MRLIKSLALLLLLSCNFNVIAGITDTLKQKEMPALIKGYLSSSFYNYYLLDSFSRNNDSIKASNCLQKINPYYLLWEWKETERPDTNLEKYSLTLISREAFLKSYKQAMSHKSPDYLLFKKMADEDQEIRFYDEKGGDEYTSKRTRMHMRVTDSVHAACLYAYVQKQGWPSFENGSMYATILAIHDHQHHGYYMPYLKKAAAAGLFDMNALRLINYFLKTSNDDKLLEQALAKGTYKSFDINDMFQESLPACITRIGKLLQDSCGKNIKYYYVQYVTNEEEKGVWFYKIAKQPKNIMDQFQEGLAQYCPKLFYKGTDIWDIKYLPGEKSSLKFIVISK